MAGPITWRSLQAPDLYGASRMMTGAQESLNGGIQALRNSLTEAQGTREANVGKMTDYNTGLVLDKLASYKSPEELAAAQQAGEIDTLKQSLGGVFDRNKLRGAEAEQIQKLQGQWQANQAFADKQFEIKARPLLDTYNTLLSENKVDEARQFLADNELPEKGMLAMKARDMQQKILAERNAATTFANSQTNFNNSQTDFQNRQADRLREEQRRATRERIDLLVPTVVESGLSQADGRADLLKTLASENIRGEDATQAVANYDALYAAKNDPTAAQQIEAQTQAENEYLNLQQKIRDNPVEPVLRTSDEAKLTIDEVYDFAKKQTKDEETDTVAVLDTALEKFYQDIGGKKNLPANFPLGAVLKAALGESGGATHFFPGGDDNYDVDKVTAKLLELGRAELVNSERGGIVDQAHQDFLNKTSPLGRAAIKKSLGLGGK